MKRSSQNWRVYRHLKAGKAITQIDCDRGLDDGGKPIKRLASRINDLRNLGYDFKIETLPNRLARYSLKKKGVQRLELSDGRVIEEVVYR